MQEEPHTMTDSTTCVVCGIGKARTTSSPPVCETCLSLPRSQFIRLAKARVEVLHRHANDLDTLIAHIENEPH